MSDGIKRGIAICTFNRAKNLGAVLDAVSQTAPPGTRIVVCDDGSTDDTPAVVAGYSDCILVRGPNLGVGYNKNRALFTLQDCHYITILEDDLVPQWKGWFEMYEAATNYTGINHWCRVQNNQVDEVVPSFSQDLKIHEWVPLYATSPRGDFTFLTKKVVEKVGGFNPMFKGVGFAHGEWSKRVHKAGLIPHPHRWIDLRHTKKGDPFTQLGDREGGRWLVDKKIWKEQLKVNRAVERKLKEQDYLHCPLTLS